VEVPRDQHIRSSHPENLSKRKTAPPNFIPNGFPWESIRENVPPTPSNSIGADLPEEVETAITKSEKKSSSSSSNPALNVPDHGEMLELEEQFSELCVMYDSLFGFRDEKKNNNHKHHSQVYENVENKESSFSSHHLSDDFTALETPSRLKKKRRSVPTVKDLLSDSDSITEDKVPTENHVERALVNLQPLQLSDPQPFLQRYISKSQFSLPSPKKVHSPVSKSISVALDSTRPWVIIRRYGMRGGKKIRLPNSLDDLIIISGEKLCIHPVCIREVSTEAEIEDITAIEPDSVLWVMTEEDELTFGSSDMLL